MSGGGYQIIRNKLLLQQHCSILLEPIYVSSRSFQLRGYRTKQKLMIGEGSSTLLRRHFRKKPLLCQQPNQYDLHRTYASSSGNGKILGQRAGRERFYLLVDVQPCKPPFTDDWTECASDTNEETTVMSPISAGVDGTNSASGIVVNQKSLSRHHRMLLPKSPARSLKALPDPNGNHSPDATVVQTTKDWDWFTVTLDGRSLRTPANLPLSVPSQSLAHAIAAEWNSVGGTIMSTIQPVQMPLMTLTCTALDQVSIQPDHYRDECLRYLHTDTICYWSDPVQDRVLYQQQQRQWDPLHAWLSDEFCLPWQPATVQSDAWFLARGKLPHSPALVQACTDWVHSLDAWHIAALHSACAECKSFFLAVALLLRKLEPSSVQQASRVEEEFQIESWGMVEGQHDYDRLNASIQLSVAAFLVDLLAVEVQLMG